MLYPHVDLFIALLQSENSFLKWDAIRIVANLATVDERGRIEQILGRLPGTYSRHGHGHGGQHDSECRHDRPGQTGADGHDCPGDPQSAMGQVPRPMNAGTSPSGRPSNRWIASSTGLSARKTFWSSSARNHNSRNSTRNKAVAFLKKHERAAG